MDIDDVEDEPPMDDYAIFDEVPEKPPAHDEGDDHEEADEDEEEEEEEEEDEQPNLQYDSDGSEKPDEDIVHMEFKPSYKTANKLSFSALCERLEFLDRYQTDKKNRARTMSREERLKILLPPRLLDKTGKIKRNGSPFPLFRLLMPDKDSSRRTTTKEKTLAAAYATALGWGTTGEKTEALKNYSDPQAVKVFGETTRAGDFSLVVEAAVKSLPEYPPSKTTIGDVNQVIDELVTALANAYKNRRKGNSGSNESQQWMASQSQSQQTQQTKAKSQFKMAKKIRADIVKTFVEGLKLSPVEHKWIVRILLEDIKIGIGADTILQWYSPHANDIWKSHNSLKAVCDKLSNPVYIAQREKEIRETQERLKQQRFWQLYEVSTNPDPVTLGNTISAMKSERTSFESCMADMAAKHHEILKKLPKGDPIKESLAIKFPAFCAEIKMDGERMVVHVNRGKVTMQTRQGRWYSPLYSPIIGPALRRALSKYDVDVILDGEILAWDNKAGRNIEFGNNRPVAIERQNYLKKHSLVEDIDRGLHKGEKDAYIIDFADAKNWSFDKDSKQDGGLSGEDCWMKFVAFDVIFVGGPDGKKALAEALSPDPPPSEAGSIAHLDGFERKRVLYHLLEEQRNEIEIVETVVIRPNGECAKGEEYFSHAAPIKECDIPAFTLDSTKWTLNVGHPSLQKIDTTRRKGRTDLEISQRRTYVVNDFYLNIVDQKRLEGLIFKDLAAPYVLRNKLGLWRKIKPDYSKHVLSDLDVLIIGGSYAMGRRSGTISGFLCACVDSKDPTKFMPFCRINANSLRREVLDRIWGHTGFTVGEGTGKWFREEEHGETLPDFISQRSLQFGKETYDGWRFDRVKNYPDLFIRPKDSCVLTVNASEIVTTEEYSSGVTLRFPRADKPRLDGDAKDPSDIESDESLMSKLIDHKDKMKKYATANPTYEIASPSKAKRSGDGEDDRICQFQTAEAYWSSQKRKKKREKAAGRVKQVRWEEKQSSLLECIKFHVVEGSFAFDPDGVDGEQAKMEGWFEEAGRVHCASDIEAFILKHGGQVLRSPGLDTYIVAGSSDLKVETIVQGLDRAKSKKRKAPTSQEVGILGVLKWTYVFSIVHRWILEAKRRLKEMDGYSTDESDDARFNDGETILTTIPDLLKPRFYDLLARSKVHGQDPFQSIWSHGALDTTTMKQALAVVQEEEERMSKKPKMKGIDVTWQSRALNSLAEDSRWVMSCEREKLWPYGSQAETSNPSSNPFPPGSKRKEVATVYPHCLFGNSVSSVSGDLPTYDYLDNSVLPKKATSGKESSLAASALPLMRAMGCIVVPNLTKNVTHVLCEMAEGTDSFTWCPGADLDGIFDNDEHGQELAKCLEDFVGQPVLLVSHGWVNAVYDS